MDRKQEDHLSRWIKSKNRRPLVIRGARQVGKSTLVRQFCKKNKITLYEINLEKHLPLTQLFLNKNIPALIEEISDLIQKKIRPSEKCVLFLDEIQAIPEAFHCLRYFYEEIPELAVIAAGSLLEILLNEHEYSMPVGRVEFMYMGPMTFDEFTRALGETYFSDKLSKLQNVEELTDSLHEKGLKLLRQYLFIGGMPEAIKTFIDDGIEKVPQIHSQILQTYQSDFVKYSKKSHHQKIQKVFRFVFLNPCKKIKYTNISKDDLSRDLKYNLELLIQARVMAPVIHSNCTGLPLEVLQNESTFKMLALDVGLVNFMQGVPWNTFRHYEETELLNEGALAEQFVGQHLLFQKPFFIEPKLFYWLREGKSTNAEVDFIYESDNYLFPIEVKAGNSGKLRSLHQFMLHIQYKKKRAMRFNLSKGRSESISQIANGSNLTYSLLTLPLYMIDHWQRFASQ